MADLTLRSILLVLGFFVVQAWANIDLPARNTCCVNALMDIFGDFSFVGGGYGDYYETLCTNHLAVLSVYSCAKTYCKPSDIAPGFALLGGYCEEYGETELLPMSLFAANLTPAAISTLPIYPRNVLNETDNQTSAFLIDQNWYDVAYTTESNQNNEMYYESYYGYGIYGFWGGVLLYGMVQNLIRRLVERRRGWVAVDAEGAGHTAAAAPTPAILRPFVPAYALARKYFIMPALLSKYHLRQFWGCSLPTRAETFVVAAFWIYSLITCCVQYHANNGNIYWPTIAPQIWNHIAWRTGTEAYFCLPLIWMFSGRNNIFIWLTGWQYSTFNMFHRHIARIATIEGIMHSIGWTAYFFAAGYDSYFYSDFKERYFYLSAAATVVMSLIVLFSFSYFRNKFYESFLLIHIIFSILLIAFLYYHTIIFDMDEYNYPFLVPPIVMWCFDRFLRLVRQAWCNLYVGFGGGKNLHRTTRASITLNESANLLTIDIVPGNARLRPGPGQHYYLYQPLRFLGWENHPFTLAYWNRESTDNDDGRVHLVFLVRAYDGWTKNLQKQCLKAAARTIAPRMILEGPYGKAEPMHAFDHVLLIAGGSGIAAVMPYLLDHVHRSHDNSHSGRLLTRTCRLTLVWVDRHVDFMQLLASGPLASALAHGDMHVHFYTTSASFASQANVSTASSSTDDVPDVSSPVDSEKTPHAGRPDVAAIIQAEAGYVYGTDARLAVMACGPATLSDTARHVTAQAMESKKDSIEYFEEDFGW